MCAQLRNFLVAVFIILWSSNLWSSVYLEKSRYTDRALSLKLWEHPQWLRLGHYEKSFFGYSSPFRGTFFIDKKGFESPQRELLASLNTLFGHQEKSPLQCKYPARVRWFAEQLLIPANELNECADLKKWKTELNAKSISLIFAASDMGNASSSFGHTFLKLINPNLNNNKDLTNYGVNYAAKTDASPGLFYALKGLFGFYDGVFTMMPYHQKMREYINAEGRDLWEYSLGFSSEEVDRLIDHLVEIEPAAAPYYFLSDNCAYQILKTLEVIRPDLDVAQRFHFFVIPIDTLKVFFRDSTLIKTRVYKKSLKSDYQDGLSQLNDNQLQVLKKVIANTEDVDKKNLSDAEMIPVVEVATKHLALEEFRQQESKTEEIYKLSVFRAGLGRRAELISGPKSPQAPEESHDSSAVYLGAGWLKNFSDNSENYTSFKFRTSFHELEQMDSGTVKFSHLELLSFEGRFFQETQDIKLHRMTVFHLLNTAPMTTLDRNISWKVRLDLRDEWSLDAEAAVGASLDFGYGRFISLLTGRVLHYQERYWNGAGPELMYVVRPYESVGVSVSGAYFFIAEEDSFFRYQAKVNWSFRKNWDVQWIIESLRPQEVDIGMRFVYNFIL